MNEYNIDGNHLFKFNRLLEAVTLNLVPGNLTELTIQFGVMNIDKVLLRSALPFFCNLKKFTYSACGLKTYGQAQEHVLTEVIGNSHQLTALDVRYVRTSSSWLRFKHLKNLQRLTVLFVELSAYSAFRQYIQSRPSLKSLVLSIGSVHHQVNFGIFLTIMTISSYILLLFLQHLCKLITQYIPHLEEFEIRNSYLQLPHGDDFDFSPVPFKFIKKENVPDTDESQEDNDEDVRIFIYLPRFSSNSVSYYYFSQTEEGETTFEDSGDEDDFDMEDSDSDIDDVRDPELNANIDHVAKWKEVYAGMNKMNQLKKTWLKSHFTNCSDLYDILKDMGTQNTLEHLTIQFSILEDDFTFNDDFLAEPFPQGFTMLKALRLISPSIDTQSFIRHFVRFLPNMTKCILDMDKIDRFVQDTICNLVDAAENLEILALKMPAMNIDSLLYLKLLDVQFCKLKRSAGMRPLNIYINSSPQKTKCLTELKEKYNENVVAIKIRSFMTWETDPL